jgi:hypothetical protein
LSSHTHTTLCVAQQALEEEAAQEQARRDAIKAKKADELAKKKALLRHQKDLAKREQALRKKMEDVLNTGEQQVRRGQSAQQKLAHACTLTPHVCVFRCAV